MVAVSYSMGLTIALTVPVPLAATNGLVSTLGVPFVRVEFFENDGVLLGVGGSRKGTLT